MTREVTAPADIFIAGRNVELCLHPGLNVCDSNAYDAIRITSATEGREKIGRPTASATRTYVSDEPPSPSPSGHVIRHIPRGA